jgi:hypothetical protein
MLEGANATGQRACGPHMTNSRTGIVRRRSPISVNGGGDRSETLLCQTCNAVVLSLLRACQWVSRIPQYLGSGSKHIHIYNQLRPIRDSGYWAKSNVVSDVSVCSYKIELLAQGLKSAGVRPPASARRMRCLISLMTRAQAPETTETEPPNPPGPRGP